MTISVSFHWKVILIIANVVVRDVMHLSQDEINMINRFDQKEKEIWQIVVRKLRVWSAKGSGAPEGEEAIPCRPYCILVNNLYPLGQVRGKKNASQTIEST